MRLLFPKAGEAILVALLLGAFVFLARALPDTGGMPLDIAVAAWLARHDSDAGQVVFTWVSWLGDTALGGLLVAAVLMLLHRGRWAAAATVTVASVAAPLIDVALKPLFHRGRPDYALEFITGTTWSFPSGHSMSSLVGFGIVAYFRFKHERNETRRVMIVVLACVAVAAIGFSRLYLGVHYVSDVVGGWLAGAIWLFVSIEGYRFGYARRLDAATKHTGA